MKPSKNIEKIIKNINIETVLDDVVRAFEASKVITTAATKLNIRRTITKSPITKLAAAAVITIALMLNINHVGGSINMENAAFAKVGQPILNVPTETLMLSTDHTYIGLLIAVNLVAGFGFAVPIVRLLGKVDGKARSTCGYFVVLIGIYFLESIAFGAGTTAHVISLGLAFLWGIVFGLRLRTRVSAAEALKISFFLSLYSCLPAASFYFFIPAAKLITGINILSAAEGAGFGIPTSLPWPINTILGFYAALVIATVVFKTVITTGEVSLLIHLAEKSWKKISNAGSVIIAICAFVIILLAATRPCAPPELVIMGTVNDAKTGQPIAGAKVSDGGYGPKPSWDIIQAGDCGAHGAITDSQGKYRYLTWPEHHSIEAEAPGYKTQRKSLYEGHLGDFFEEQKEQQKLINFMLEPE
ncbi:MAG: carboxypeptidase-like regulatory domain-containing protein [Planctomycetota bacterium]|jgi:hypothetical protein